MSELYCSLKWQNWRAALRQLLVVARFTWSLMLWHCVRSYILYDD